MRRVQAVGMSGSCPVQHNDSSAAGRLRPNAVIGKVGFLPVSVPNENEHNETNDRTPCNEESYHHLFRRLSPYFPLRLKHR